MNESKCDNNSSVFNAKNKNSDTNKSHTKKYMNGGTGMYVWKKQTK